MKRLPSPSFAVLAVLLLAACASTTSTSGSPTAVPPTAEPTEPIVSPSAPPSATPEPSPTEAASDSIATDAIVVAQVDGIRIRATPGLDGAQLGTLASGYESLVVDGPELVDGMEWYLVSGLGLPPASGCATGPDWTNPYTCPVWLGWAARAGTEGSSWLEEVEPECADPNGALDDFAYQPRYLHIACYGDEPLSLRGHVIASQSGPDCPGVPAELQWLGCSPRYELASTPDVVGLPMGVPPGDSLAGGGGEFVVEGHFDDPAAAGCTYGDEPERSVLTCRSQFVVDSAVATGN